MNPSPSYRLRDIAGALRAHHEEGDFADCHEHIRMDLQSLPLALENIADELDGIRKAAA